MISLLSYALFFSFSHSEKALPSYVVDVGEPPEWLPSEKQPAAEVDRWYVDVNDAECKPFRYKGSLGNFNNFASRVDCENHKIFTHEEKIKACEEPVKIGECNSSGPNVQLRWSYNKNTGECIQFKYSGCGGNANNFFSEDECKNVCLNNLNGPTLSTTNSNKYLNVPNKFDCEFVSEIQTVSQKVGVVPLKSEKRCVYQAIDQDAKRGYFSNLPYCVKTCIDDQVKACTSLEPYQIDPPDVVTEMDKIREYFYFNRDESSCKPFWSVPPLDNVTIDTGNYNIFSSVEYCASFCPAGPVVTNSPCRLSKEGEASSTDKYKIKRFYYNQKNNKCSHFAFNGKYLNLNNFKSRTVCRRICKNP